MKPGWKIVSTLYFESDKVNESPDHFGERDVIVNVHSDVYDNKQVHKLQSNGILHLTAANRDSNSELNCDNEHDKIILSKFVEPLHDILSSMLLDDITIDTIVNSLVESYSTYTTGNAGVVVILEYNFNKPVTDDVKDISEIATVNYRMTR
jgi:hypothetical protein